jgi:OTU-like cysteine protease
VNDYIRDNHSKYIWTSPDFCETFAEAIVGDGFNTSDYFVRMSLNSSWGGMIEICAVAEMFHVNIQIFENYADPKRINSINKELGKPSQSVIQLRKDRKAVKSQVAAINYANALECRSQV